MLNNGIDKELGDYRFLNWSHKRNSSGTAGTFLKAYEIYDGKKLYYKMSDFDYHNGIIGHECVNEIVCDRLLSILGIEHLSYRLLHALVTVDDREYDTYICVSDNFKKPGESKIALDDLYDIQKATDESRLDFCIRMGWEDQIYSMLVADFLIMNRDRHGANIEILKSGRNYRMAPLFDHGLSLLFSAHTEDAVRAFDPMADIPVQSFLGSRSLYENLKLIPEDRSPMIRRLHEDDREYLLAGLKGIMPQQHLDKIWETIWKRWAYYEDMRNKR